MLAGGRVATLSWSRQAWVDLSLQNHLGHLWRCAPASARCAPSQCPAAAPARSARSYADCVRGGPLCCPATGPAVGALIWKAAREATCIFSMAWQALGELFRSIYDAMPHASYDSFVAQPCRSSFRDGLRATTHLDRPREPPVVSASPRAHRHVLHACALSHAPARTSPCASRTPQDRREGRVVAFVR